MSLVFDRMTFVRRRSNWWNYEREVALAGDVESEFND